MICFLKCGRINLGELMHGILLNHLYVFITLSKMIVLVVRDLKSELLGYAPRVKILKPDADATPTLNLPDGHDKCVSESGIFSIKNE
ncbi:THAP domain-containing protein 4-like [Aphis craccivora]|uniref:THAP domain-containing protein 4-like n=1 Tax=Aphis craccivora TaxID=307492 RepID=A0A6G0W3A2_APHCR|nr:THAP domain-containing protein 4-like [Aphis craccivora]